MLRRHHPVTTDGNARKGNISSQHSTSTSQWNRWVVSFWTIFMLTTAVLHFDVTLAGKNDPKLIESYDEVDFGRVSHSKQPPMSSVIRRPTTAYAYSDPLPSNSQEYPFNSLDTTTINAPQPTETEVIERRHPSLVRSLSTSSLTSNTIPFGRVSDSNNEEEEEPSTNAPGTEANQGNGQPQRKSNPSTKVGTATTPKPVGNPAAAKTDMKTTIITAVIIVVLALTLLCGLCYYFPSLRRVFYCFERKRNVNAGYSGSNPGTPRSPRSRTRASLHVATCPSPKRTSTGSRRTHTTVSDDDALHVSFEGDSEAAHRSPWDSGLGPSRTSPCFTNSSPRAKLVRSPATQNDLRRSPRDHHIVQVPHEDWKHSRGRPNKVTEATSHSSPTREVMTHMKPKLAENARASPVRSQPMPTSVSPRGAAHSQLKSAASFNKNSVRGIVSREATVSSPHYGSRANFSPSQVPYARHGLPQGTNRYFDVQSEDTFEI